MTSPADYGVSRPFVPSVALISEGDGRFDLNGFAFAPNSCYDATGVQLGPPPHAEMQIPELVNIRLNVTYARSPGRVCLLYLKPLHWLGENLDIGGDKTHALVHVVLDDSCVLHSVLVPLPGIAEAAVFDKKQKLTDIDSALRGFGSAEGMDVLLKKMKDRGR